MLNFVCRVKRLRLNSAAASCPMNRQLNFSCRNHFTFVELVVILGVFALLTVTLLPALNRTLAADRKLACAGNLKKSGAALLAYSFDHDGFIPAPFARNAQGEVRWWSGRLLHGKYAAAEQDLRCPAIPMVGKHAATETYGISRLNESGRSDSGIFRNLNRLEVFWANYPLAADTVAKNKDGVRQQFMYDTWYSTAGCLGLVHEDSCSLVMADGHVVSWKAADFAAHNRNTTEKIYAASDLKGKKVNF